MMNNLQREIEIGNTKYFKLPIVEFDQNGNKAYLTSMRIAEFEEVAMLRQVDVNKKDEIKTSDIKQTEQIMIEKLDALDDEPFNRPEEQKRVNNITSYLSSDKTIIPNTIIVGAAFKENNEDLDFSFPYQEKSPEEVKDTNWLESFNDTDGAFIDNNFLYLPVKEKSVIIIDGQHRYLAMRQLENNIKNNFCIPLVFLLGYKPEQQAEIFVTINYEQKPVNKSLLTSLKNTFLKKVTDDKIIYGYIHFLNTDPRSPLVNRIKMLGVGSGYVSLAFLQNLIKDLITPQRIKSQKIPIFSAIFKDQENRYIILQLLLNYFKAIGHVLNKSDFVNIEDVIKNKNNKCTSKNMLWDQNCTILTKSIGIGAFVQVFPRIILKILDQKELECLSYMDLKKIEYEDFLIALSNIRDFNFKASLSGSSLGLMNQLKSEMQELFSLEKYDRIYAEKIEWIIYK